MGAAGRRRGGSPGVAGGWREEKKTNKNKSREAVKCKAEGGKK